MTMREYLVTIHEDGHVTANEYEEPQGFVYCDSEAAVVRGAYNRALHDVEIILEAEKAHCAVNSKFGTRQGWEIRADECERLKTAIARLFRTS